MNNMLLQDYIDKQTKAASLAVFRFLFGLIMAISIIRFWYNGWIEKLYLLPKFHFHYTGFDFIQVPGQWTYLLFIICFISAVGVCIGWKYRLSITTFFLCFTYIELMDKTTYLNHYYFVSVMSFLLIFLPAHAYYSVDAKHNKLIGSRYIPRWTVDIVKLMLAIVYIYAGLAKLNYDWIMLAMPLSIWLPTKMDIPLLGAVMHEKWLHYLFSWGGAIYDLSIVFLLLWKRTRVFAFIIVIVFHVLTRVLFPIGMFPYIMIAGTIIFFSPEFHEKFMEFVVRFFPFDKLMSRDGAVAIDQEEPPQNEHFNSVIGIHQIPFVRYILMAFMAFQLIFPLRCFFLTDNVYWTEQGYRFSWRVMLMEKTGYTNFKIVDSLSQKRFYVQNEDFLTSLQQKQMSTQPDFILEYAQYLAQHFSSQGHENIEVYVESYAALNGRPNQPFIDPNVNLLDVSYRELCQNHITPLHE